MQSDQGLHVLSISIRYPLNLSKWATKALIRMHKCAGCSVTPLSVCTKKVEANQVKSVDYGKNDIGRVSDKMA